MNREKAIDLLDNLIGMVEDNQESDYDTALKMAIQALSQEPCTDAVSREAVIEILENYGCTNKEGLLFEDIRALPSVQPSRKGHWIDALYSRKCSECGYDMCKKDEWGQFIPDKACPSCGCRMVGDAE